MCRLSEDAQQVFKAKVLLIHLNKKQQRASCRVAANQGFIGKLNKQQAANTTKQLATMSMKQQLI